MKITPLKDRILVKVKESTAKTAGGIYIPDTVKEDKLLEGEVISVGKLENVTLSVGDRVIFESYAGSELKINGEKHLIIDIKNILARIEWFWGDYNGKTNPIWWKGKAKHHKWSK